MRFLAILLLLAITFGCSSPQTDQHPTEKTADKEQITSEKNDKENHEAKSEGQAGPVTFQTSTYDDPEFADRVSEHQVSLKELSDKGVFSAIHAKLVQKLGQKHQAYFKSKSDYELLAWAKGNLFRENKSDCGFIVYDKKNQRISILVYRETTDKYAELFRDIQVENGLENAGCNYSSFGTIDYQLAEEILYQEEYLVKNPENYLESSPVKITDLAKNEDFILKEGCFSKKVSKKETSNSLAIATSSVYNNWEALRYNEANNSFVIYYGQAFAD
jgi:hypothetical protein